MSDQKEKKENFFTRMGQAENRGFEITMFIISVVVAIAVFVSIIWLAVLWRQDASDSVVDDEDTLASVTESAVTVTEEPTATPHGDVGKERLYPPRSHKTAGH